MSATPESWAVRGAASAAASRGQVNVSAGATLTIEGAREYARRILAAAADAEAQQHGIDPNVTRLPNPLVLVMGPAEAKVLLTEVEQNIEWWEQSRKMRLATTQQKLQFDEKLLVLGFVGEQLRDQLAPLRGARADCGRPHTTTTSRGRRCAPRGGEGA